MLGFALGILAKSLLGPRCTVLFHYPIYTKPAQLLFKIMSLRHQTVLLVHDIDAARGIDKTQNFKALQHADACISSGKLAKVPEVSRLIKININLECWDYLLSPKRSIDPRTNTGAILYAGSLDPEKSPWLYTKDRKVPLILAGIGCKTEALLTLDQFLGPFPSDSPNFPSHISWGLVWDGTSSTSLQGPTGEYQLINQPHKLSLYIAMGMPVICQRRSHIRDFIVKNNIGFDVGDINDIPKLINSLTEDRYQKMMQSIASVREKVISGYFFSSALRSVELLRNSRH